MYGSGHYTSAYPPGEGEPSSLRFRLCYSFPASAISMEAMELVHAM